MLITMLCFFTEIKAQSPGGISGEEAWFRTKKSKEWKDYSGDSIAILGIGDNIFTYIPAPNKALYLNFNAAMRFEQNDYSIFVNLPHTLLKQYTSFGVYAPLPPIANNAFPYSSFPKIVTSYYASKPNHSIWGEDLGKDVILSTDYYEDFQTDLPTMQDMIWGNACYNGYISEFIAYQRVLSPLERRQVETYLALRHGITLNGSYIGSNGNLLWDYSQNYNYNNRVTGIFRDDASGISQALSATSHELPILSEATYGYKTSYQNNDPSRLPSASHLLVIGREYGSKMTDGDYLIWGDDDNSTQSYALYNEDSEVTWHNLGRTWKVQTNMWQHDYANNFSANNFSVTDRGFYYNIEQSSNGASYFKKAYNADDDFYLEFYCPRFHPTFTVGLGGEYDTHCTYGITITTNGNIRTVSTGSDGRTPLMPNVNGHKVTIRKEGNQIYFQSDGEPFYQISYTPQERYSTIISTTGSSENILTLNGLRIGGDHDDGCQALLSYDLIADSLNFKKHKSGRVCMLIDPSGEGDFSRDDIIYIPTTDFDTTRKKLYFHNIFFDRDGNNEDAFTFGWCDDLDARLTPHKATCRSNSTLSNGRIDVEVLAGSPTFQCTVSSIDNPSAEPQERLFCDRGTTFNNLPPGSYLVTLSQLGGTNMVTSSLAPNETVDTYFTVFNPRTISWTIADLESSYSIAFVHNGSSHVFSVDGRFLTHTINGDLMNQETLSIGQTINIWLKVHQGILPSSGDFVLGDSLSDVPSLTINLSRGNSRINNFIIQTNFGEHVININLSENTYIESVAPVTYERIVNVGSECDPTLPHGVEHIARNVSTNRNPKSQKTIEEEVADNNHFTVKATSAPMTFEAVLNDEGPADIIVFTTGGAIVEKHSFPTGLNNRTFQFTVPQHGVYIIKALMNNNEYSYKIATNR